MRTFPSRRTWGSDNRDRMSLLATASSSPSSSPRTDVQTRLTEGEKRGGVVSSNTGTCSSSDKQQAPQRSIPEMDQSGSIKFVAAYEERVSPNAEVLDTTQPLSTPDHSFSAELERSSGYRGSSSYTNGSPSPKYQRSPVTPSPNTSSLPQKSIPTTTTATTQSDTKKSYRFSASHTRTPSNEGIQRGGEPEAASAAGSSHARSNNGGPTRIARLASLFSSRAIVRGSDELPCPSPPRSDSSSGYVGWPGTQDKRGGTVPVLAMEQSSYSDSEVGAPRTYGNTYKNSDRDSNSSTGDYNLAAVLVNDAAAANSPLMKAAASGDTVRRSSPMDEEVRGVGDIYGQDQHYHSVTQLTDLWGGIGDHSANDESLSDVSTKYSKSSSAYFMPKELRALQPLEPRNPLNHRQVEAASVMRFQPWKPQPPTEEALRLKDHLTPPHRTFNATNVLGYRGLLDKTRDVPNLMDGTESDSTHSSVSGTNYGTATHNMRKGVRPRRIPPDPEDQLLEEVSSDIFDGVTNGGRTDSESDIFDGLSNAGGAQSNAPSRNGYLNRTPTIPENAQYSLGAIPRNDNENLNVVLLGGGLTTIQTTSEDFRNRQTASDFDENLSNSDYDQYGFAKIPGFNEMATAGKRVHDRSLTDSLGGISAKLLAQAQSRVPSLRAQAAISKYNNRSSERGSEVSASSAAFSDQYQMDCWGGSVGGGLQQYYVHPDEMKSLVKKFRKMSSKVIANLNTNDEMEREEDATKAFALTEMRSRIMEKDIERGLERRGGTSVVDDLVLTPYNRAAMRVRDALIVAKAWRDGAMPKDVIYTSLLTRRSERAYFILRPWDQRSRGGIRAPPQHFTWEEVGWVDDLELSQYRCHSIGPRHLRGFEMFTIGDCQSILLKLCNQECLDLRRQLNVATSEQLEAEDEMKVEEADFGVDGIMTEAEVIYLAAMEEVKTVSHKLVLAEKAFHLVRDRIEKLVAKYEALLLHFDNDAESAVAASSVVTDASSNYSDCSSHTFHEEKEREVLSRRAQRAELRAELAAREAMLAKQRVRELRKEKEMEIHVLRQKLNDLQSESSAAITEREHSVVLARAIAANRRAPTSSSQPSSAKSAITSSQIEDVKKRFRSRSAGRNGCNPSRPPPASNRGVKSSRTLRRTQQDQASKDRNSMFRAVGEEMFQQLDFYERSLKAVEQST